MGESTDIAWSTSTFNLIWGCTHAGGPGCDSCYAETFAKRMGLDLWGKNTERRIMSDAYWAKPLIWNKKAAKSGKPWRVFCASMADVFEDHPQLPEQRERLWKLIEQTPHLTWLLLTKRPQNAWDMSPWGDYWPENVWLGTSVENQRYADLRIPKLLAVPAKVRFLSIEPLLGPVDLSKWFSGNCPDCGRNITEDPCGAWPPLHSIMAIHETYGIDWIICGGESGNNHRPMDLDWARSIRDQCVGIGVSFFFKQVGGRTPKSGGNLLDGRTWEEFPTIYPTPRATLFPNE